MDIDEKERRARLGDMSAEACGIRLRAAREVTGLSQQDFAAAAGQQANSINNMEKARQHPNREVMRFLYRAHRIDFNFLLYGDFAQLPADIQAALFEALPPAASEGDQKQRLGSSPVTG